MAVGPFPLRTIRNAYCYWRWGLAKGRALITVTAGADGPFGGDRFTSFLAITKFFGTEIFLLFLGFALVVPNLFAGMLYR